jgi:hypothetical protein
MSMLNKLQALLLGLGLTSAACYADFADGNRGTHAIGSALLIPVPETLEAPLPRPLVENLSKNQRLPG